MSFDFGIVPAVAALPRTREGIRVQSVITDQKSAEALERQRRAELRALTAPEVLAAAHHLLDLAVDATWPPEKERSEGLVERQRILYRIDR